MGKVIPIRKKALRVDHTTGKVTAANKSIDRKTVQKLIDDIIIANELIYEEANWFDKD